MDGYKKYNTMNQIVPDRETKQMVVLFEGILKFMHILLKAAEEGDIEKKYYASERLIKVFEGLLMNLDYEKGKEAAELLSKSYESVIKDLLSLNFEKDQNYLVGKYKKMIEEIKKFKVLWETVDQNYNRIVENNAKPITSKMI